MEVTMNLSGNELDFPLFGQILYGGLNPALPGNADGPEYQQRMQEMIWMPAADRGVYKCAFHPPFNFKTRYYHRLLTHEANAYMADLLEMAAAETDDRVRAYLRSQLLDKHLTNCLQRLGEYCRDKNYLLHMLTVPEPGADNDFLSDIWVFHYLKVLLAKAYLEVQYVWKDMVLSAFSEQQLYVSLFGESLPVQCWLKKAETDAPRKYKSPPVPQTKAAEPLPFDIRLYYSKQELCELWKMSDSTFERRAKEPDFPKPTKYKNRNYYLKTEADAWIQRNSKI